MSVRNHAEEQGPPSEEQEDTFAPLIDLPLHQMSHVCCTWCPYPENSDRKDEALRRQIGPANMFPKNHSDPETQLLFIALIGAPRKGRR